MDSAYSQRPDEELVQLANEGVFEAFDALVSRHENKAYAIAMHMLRHREDAEDAVQTAFMSALEHLAGFRAEASFKTWLTRIVTNAALKILQKRKKNVTVSLDKDLVSQDGDSMSVIDTIAEWTENPTANMEGKELESVLTEAIDALSSGHRAVFVLRDIEGLSVRETAQALEITEANVKVRLLRARLELRERLSRVFGDDAHRLAAPEGSALERLTKTKMKDFETLLTVPSEDSLS